MTSLKYSRLLFLLALLYTTAPGRVWAQNSSGNKLKDSLLQALSHPKDDTSKIKTLFILSNFFAPNDSASSARYARQGKELSDQRNWQKGKGLYYLAMAKLYNEVSDRSLSIVNSKKAYEIFNEMGDKKNTAAAIIHMANSYQASGFYTKSIENNLEALKLYENIGFTHGRSICYNNIGVNYFYLLQYDKAIENYKKSLEIYNGENDKFGIASGLDNIAIVYLERGNYDSANIYNLSAIKIFEEINHLPGLGRIYINRGNILMKLHDATSAYQFFSKSLEINKKLNIDNGISSGNGNMGDLYFILANDTAGIYKVSPFMKKSKSVLLDSAAYYVRNALAVDKGSDDISALMDHHKALSDIEERQGHFQNALASHKNYTLYKDSIFNDENKQKLTAMESERLAAMKDQQIALQASEARRQALLKNVVLISAIAIVLLICAFIVFYNRRKKATFDSQVMEVEMKALRAQMNPHFISNSLHSINKYVMDNDKKNASIYLSKFASLMRLILENSREQEVPLEQDLHALELYMQLELLRFKNSFTYDIHIDPLIDPENTLIPPMLLQPFAENAILHGLHNKENGVIKINVRKVNEMICCVVEDNGNGSADAPVMAYDGNRKHKSFSKKIIAERLSIINRLKKAKASVNIFQIKDEQNRPGGVRVELLLPLELAF